MTNVDTIINKLKKEDIEVIDCLDEKDFYVIITPDMNISYFPNDQEIHVSFYVLVPPNVACVYTLILKSIKGIKKVYVNDVFAFSEKGDYIEGEEAFKESKKELKNKIINEFMKEQFERHMLYSHECYNC